jgi:DNA-binding Lrp family transcriptional regulator
MDRLDVRLLEMLQRNGRLTNQELGEAVGLSASQCSRRRTALEASNTITGYSANLSSEALGLDVIAFVDVTLARHASKVAEEFATLIAGVPEVQEAFAMTGEADYLLKVIVPDLKRLAVVLNDVLLASDVVQTVKSSIVLDGIKTGTYLPLPAL